MKAGHISTILMFAVIGLNLVQGYFADKDMDDLIDEKLEAKLKLKK